MSVITKIKNRGYLKAGVSLGINGLSYFDKEKSLWCGFDVDIAKAISAALLGDSSAVEFIPLQSGERFASLKSDVIDIGTFNSTLTFSREVEFGVSFMEPLLYDGEAFMVRKDTCTSLSNLKNRTVSVIRGSTTQQNLEMYFVKQNLNYEIILSDTPDEALAAYESKACNIHCLDRILLAGERLRLKNPDEHVILPDVVTREAMSPVLSSHDPVWTKTVKWILKALIEAEELDISQNNVKEKKQYAGGYLKNFLHPKREWCQTLSLQTQFIEDVISQVGNYADIYHRNLGNLSNLKLNRGENNLRSQGGLLFSPLFL